VGAEVWLAVGLGVAALLLISGFATGWAARDSAADQLELRITAERDAYQQQLEAAIAQGDSSHTAAQIVVMAERTRIDALRAATPSARRRLLLTGKPDSPASPATTSGSPGGSNGGADET